MSEPLASAASGEYLAVVTTIGAVLLAAALGAIGFVVRSLITTLRDVRHEQNAQSSGLAVLVERVTPMNAELVEHDKRLRESESGLARLEGALNAHKDTLQTLVGLRLSSRDP